MGRRLVQAGRVIAMAWVACSVPGCAQPAVVYRPAAVVLTEQGDRPLVLQLTTGERYVISGASVRNDTLHAVKLGQDSVADARLAVPVNRIVSITRTQRGFHATGIGAVAIGVGLTAVAVFILSMISGLPTS